MRQNRHQREESTIVPLSILRSLRRHLRNFSSSDSENEECENEETSKFERKRANKTIKAHMYKRKSLKKIYVN